MNIKSNVQSDVVFYRIVVPHDLTPRSNKALELAGTMAHPLRSEIVLINVINPNDPSENEEDQLTSHVGDLTQARANFLHFTARQLLPADVKCKVLILAGDPRNAILTESRKLGADLLIITTHPLTGAGYPFQGGNSEHIIHLAPCPVLTVQVPEEREAWQFDREGGAFHPHTFDQYHKLSRQLTMTCSHRPVYIGYSTLPINPSGVCE
ncbi:MAG: universal stress protein [Methylacidiphilales bacterium]|nr:universal stress protein [Candidatus Methylacidiphilales bacterium]